VKVVGFAWFVNARDAAPRQRARQKAVINRSIHGGNEGSILCSIRACPKRVAFTHAMIDAGNYLIHRRRLTVRTAVHRFEKKRAR
jgi:hypothetical protein